MFPEGLPPQLNSSEGLKSLDPMTTGARLLKTSKHALEHIKAMSDPILDSFFIWNRILSAYMECSLTRDEDRLVAISAIAKSIQPLVNDTYLAGLWVRHLPYHLLWYLESPAPVWRTPGQSQSFIAPSWSWASARGTCNFFLNIDIHQERFMIRILEAIVVPKGPDPMGQLLHAHIKLRCWLKSFSFHKIIMITRFLNLGKDRRAWVDFDEEPGRNGRKLFFMPILDLPDNGGVGGNVVYGLILSQSKRREEFRRVGRFSAYFSSNKKTYQFFKRPTYWREVGNLRRENITEHRTISDIPLEGLNIDGSDDSDDTSSWEDYTSSEEGDASSREYYHVNDPIEGNWILADIKII
jgi:hypothetical protein